MSGGNVSDELVYAFRVGPRERPTAVVCFTEREVAELVRKGEPAKGPLRRITRRESTTAALAISRGLALPKGW